MGAWKRYSNPVDAFNARHIVMDDGCWIWTGSTDRGGYGVMHVGNGSYDKAHRFSYRTSVGPIPDGKCIDHLCRNRNCVNPEHLEVVTNRENVIRGFSARLMGDCCIHGHNGFIYTNGRGYRECRMCNRISVHNYYERKTKLPRKAD